MHTYDRIWRYVARIPRGTVTTYGDVARACGLAGQARLVGYALHTLPPGADIPWFRVVNARGRISLGGESGSRQRLLLEKEGIVFSRGNIDLAIYRWREGTVQETDHVPSARARPTHGGGKGAHHHRGKKQRRGAPATRTHARARPDGGGLRPERKGKQQRKRTQ